jgi:hypothetical protein
MIAFPGEQVIYAAAIIIISIALVITGKYSVVEKTASGMAAILILVVIVAATIVFPGFEKISSGLVPSFPDDMDMAFAIPWIGFILAGSTGIMWFSYWVVAREYAGPMSDKDDIIRMSRSDAKKDDHEQKERDKVFARLKNWLKVLSVTAGIGVIGGGMVIVAFLILGTELLKPEGIVPEGVDVAKDLTSLLSEIWGRAGFWILLIGILIPLWGTILSNQDGYGRMFADGTFILSVPFLKRKKMVNKNEAGDYIPSNKLSKYKKRMVSWLTNYTGMQKFFAILLAAVLPLALFLVVRDPVEILTIGGIVAAVHTPVVVFLTIYLNHKRLPKEFRPGAFITGSMIFSGLFYGAFAVYYFTTL